MVLLFHAIYFLKSFRTHFFFNFVSNLIFISSKVHISEATLAALNGAYKVVPADGKSRNKTLEDFDVHTFFITSGMEDETKASD